MNEIIVPTHCSVQSSFHLKTHAAPYQTSTPQNSP